MLIVNESILYKAPMIDGNGLDVKTKVKSFFRCISLFMPQPFASDDMLEGKYLNDNYYNNWPVYESYMQITLGIDKDFSDQPHRIFLSFKEPVEVGLEGVIHGMA